MVDLSAPPCVSSSNTCHIPISQFWREKKCLYISYFQRQNQYFLYILLYMNFPILKKKSIYFTFITFPNIPILKRKKSIFYLQIPQTRNKKIVKFCHTSNRNVFGADPSIWGHKRAQNTLCLFSLFFCISIFLYFC